MGEVGFRHASCRSDAEITPVSSSRRTGKRPVRKAMHSIRRCMRFTAAARKYRAKVQFNMGENTSWGGKRFIRCFMLKERTKNDILEAARNAARYNPEMVEWRVDYCLCRWTAANLQKTTGKIPERDQRNPAGCSDAPRHSVSKRGRKNMVSGCASFKNGLRTGRYRIG